MWRSIVTQEDSPMAQIPDFDTLVAQSVQELRLKTAAHDAAWGLGGADWSVDQAQGEIVFTRTDGITATAPVQIVGTYNGDDDTWLWGWEHPSVVPALQEHARRVREYGLKHGIKRLTTRKLACSQDEAWELTALACKLCDAQGAYRGPAGSAFVFMTFAEVTLHKTGRPQAEPSDPVSPKTPSPPPAREAPTGDAAEAVRAFIAAYYAWNTAADARTKSLDPDSTAYEAAIKLAESEYDHIVS